jgi:hypothetical protein
MASHKSEGVNVVLSFCAIKTKNTIIRLFIFSAEFAWDLTYDGLEAVKRAYQNHLMP